MTSKNFKIQTPEQVTKSINEMDHGQMFVRPDKLDQPCMVVTDMTGGYHVVDLYTGNLYPMDTQIGKSGHPVKDIKCTLILQ